MKRALLLLTLLAACDDDKPDTADVARAKDECKQLLEHIVQISPQGQGQNAKEIVADLPIEDIQACVATDAEVRGCMAKAHDVPGIKACPNLVACAQKADAARKAAGASAVADKFVDARAKCLAGDEHAADVFDAK